MESVEITLLGQRFVISIRRVRSARGDARARARARAREQDRFPLRGVRIARTRRRRKTDVVRQVRLEI